MLLLFTLKLLTQFINLNIVQDTFDAIITAGLLFVRPGINGYTGLLGHAGRARMSEISSGAVADHDGVEGDVYKLDDFSKSVEVLEMTCEAFQPVEASKDFILLDPPAALTSLAAITSNHLALPSITLGPQLSNIVFEDVDIALWMLVFFFGLFLALIRWPTALGSPPRAKTHSQSTRGTQNNHQGDTYSDSKYPSRGNSGSSSNENSSNSSGSGIPSGSGSGSRPPPNPVVPPSDISSVSSTLLSILDGTYIGAYFGSGGPPPPPPPPPPGNNSALYDSSDSDSEYESDDWSHPHRLRFGLRTRPRVKSQHRRRKINKHRKTNDTVSTVNADLNPNRDIEIDIPAGLILSGDVLPSELDMERQEKMRSLMRFVKWCAGISGLSGLVRIISPPVKKIEVNEMDTALHAILNGEVAPMANITTINLEKLASPTTTATRKAVNCSLGFAPTESTFDDLGVDLNIVLESEVGVDPERSANAVAAMFGLLQRLLWDGTDNLTKGGDMARDSDWTNLDLSEAPTLLSLRPDTVDENCAQDVKSGVILCLSSSSSSSAASISSSALTAIRSGTSSLPPSRSTLSIDLRIGSGEGLDVCPNVPSFYRGCEMYAALLELSPPTKTVTGLKSVGIGLQVPFSSRLAMFGVRTLPARDHRTLEYSSPTSHTAPLVLSSASTSGTSITSPNLVVSMTNPKEKPSTADTTVNSLPPSTSKPNLPVMAFNAVWTVLNILCGYLYSTWGIVTLLMICIWLYKLIGEIETPNDYEDQEDDDNSVHSRGLRRQRFNQEQGSPLAKQTTPSKIPVSVTRVDVQDVMRRMDLIYGNGGSPMVSSDDGSWSSSSSDNVE